MAEEVEPVTDALPAIFEHGDTEERRTAIIALLESRESDARVLGLLERGLGDEDWRVRKESVRVALELSARIDVTPALVSAVAQGENVGLRNSAIDVLGQLHATAQLVAALPHVTPTAKKFFIEALGDTRDPAAVAALVAEAAGDDQNTTASALDALARIGGPEAEAALRHHLGSSDPFERLAAIDGLDRLAATVPWSEVEPVLGDRMSRRAAIPLLGRSGSVEAVEVLMGALAERSQSVLSSSATALVTLYDASSEIATVIAERSEHLPERARYGLRELVLDGDLAARQAAAHILLLAKDEPALSGVMPLVAGGTLPAEALSAFGRWGVSASRPLLEVQEHSQGLVRATALELASDLAVAADARATDASLARRVLTALRRGLQESSDPPVLCAAARCIASWAEPDDAEELVRLAATGTSEVAIACSGALAALLRSHPEAVQLATRSIALEGSSGAALAAVVARIGGDEALDQLQTGLSAQDAQTRAACVQALSTVGGLRAAELIGFALADEDVQVRISAAQVLGTMRDDDGRSLGSDSLLLALESDVSAVQAAAARALGSAKETRAVDPLRELIRSSAEGVAVAAMEALRHLSDPALGDLLVEALGHPDEEVVKQALSAIRDRGGERVVSQLSVGLEHPAWHVRSLGVRLLAEEGSTGARYVLTLRRERESDPMVQRAIEAALSHDWGV